MGKRSCKRARDVGEEACCYGVCVFCGSGGALFARLLSLISPLNGGFLLQGAQVALSVCVCVFYSQVDHGE